jgi:lipoteichoic acid synthase
MHISISDDKLTITKGELWGLSALVLVVWLKFFAIDYKIAEVLNWPLFAGLDGHMFKCSFRALAVGLPSLAAILCVIVPVSMLPSKFRIYAYLIVDFLFSLLAITDMLFIRYYSDIFTFHDIMLIPQTGLIVSSIWSLIKSYDLLFFADIAIAIAIKLCCGSHLHFCRLNRRRIIISVLIVVCSITVQILCVLHLFQNRPTVINAMYDRLSVCAWVSVASYHWGDAGTLLMTTLKSDKVPDKKIKEIKTWFEKKDSVSCIPLAKGKNLIMLQCEALQYFVIDLKINGVEVTPNLNRFRHDSLYFTHAWNQTAGGLSSDSEFMANTGMFPAAFGAAYTRFDRNTYNSLAKALRKKGYHAVVVQGTYSAFWNCHRMHPKLGFEKQYSRNTFPKDEFIGLGLSDKAIFSRAFDVFEKLREPFYGFIVTLSSHHPFDFPGLDDGSLTLPGELRGTLVGNYLIAIHYYDKQLGYFLDNLRKSGLMDKSVVVIYGDHPAIPIADKEELGKLVGHNLDDTYEWIKTRRVPMFIRIPGKNGICLLSGDKKMDTGQMDILPTVSKLLGVDIMTAFGKNLLGKESGNPVIFRKGAYIKDGIYIDPGSDTAVILATGKKMKCKTFENTTKEVNKILGYNDLILDKNLIANILNK